MTGWKIKGCKLSSCERLVLAESALCLTFKKSAAFYRYAIENTKCCFTATAVWKSFKACC
jgi:hypothetical protein